MDIATLRHTFASRIRKLREGKLNQGKFADSVGISRGAMSYYEQEARTPDIGVLRAICVEYDVSADYMLGIIPDRNHAVSDVCRETGLSPESARRLRLISRLVDTEYHSNEHMVEEFGADIFDVMRLTPFTSVPELMNVLIEHDEGLSLLTLLGAIILGAEVDNGDAVQSMLKLKSASKNFEIAVPIKNLTAALWVNIQSNAEKLREQIQAESAERV